MDSTDPLQPALYEAVENAVRATRPDLPEREIGALVEQFVVSGLQAVRNSGTDWVSTAREMVEAKRRLAEARSRLAQLPVETSPAAIVDPEWEPLDAAMQTYAEELLAIPGVVGFGLRTRRRAGVDVGEPCVAVFVERKRTPRGLARARLRAIPAFLPTPDGREVPVDVVQAGRFRPHLLCGSSVGHAAVGSKNRWTTIGLVARDRATGREVVLTAMHLTGLTQFPPGHPLSFVAPDGSTSGSRHLGSLIAGTRHGVDAAKISVDIPGMVQPVIRAIGPINGSRVLSHPGDRDAPVQLFGARSGYLRGAVDTPRMYLPQFGLDQVFLAAIPTRPGDSGSAVVDMDRRVLGLVVGELTGQPHLRVVSPIGPILSTLHCHL